MHEPIMVCPTADAVEPCLKHAKLAIATPVVQVLQEKNGRNFFFQYGAKEQLICYLYQEVELMLP